MNQKGQIRQKQHLFTSFSTHYRVDIIMGHNLFIEEEKTCYGLISIIYKNFYFNLPFRYLRTLYMSTRNEHYFDPEAFRATLVTFPGKVHLSLARILCEWCYPTKRLVAVLYSFLKFQYLINDLFYS